MIPPRYFIRSLVHSLVVAIFLPSSCSLSPSFLGLLLLFLPRVSPACNPLGKVLELSLLFFCQKELRGSILDCRIGTLLYLRLIASIVLARFSISAFIEGGWLFNYQPLPFSVWIQLQVRGNMIISFTLFTKVPWDLYI
jgi:hypothetical protein